MRPQNEFTIAGIPRKTDAKLDELAAEPLAACLRFDIEQTQAGRSIVVLCQKHGADNIAVSFGNPAPLAHGIEILCETRDDLGDERFETNIPAIFPRIKHAVAMDDPTADRPVAADGSEWAKGAPDRESVPRCMPNARCRVARNPIWYAAARRSRYRPARLDPRRLSHPIWSGRDFARGRPQARCIC